MTLTDVIQFLLARGAIIFEIENSWRSFLIFFVALILFLFCDTNVLRRPQPKPSQVKKRHKVFPYWRHIILNGVAIVGEGGGAHRSFSVARNHDATE